MIASKRCGQRSTNCQTISSTRKQEEGTHIAEEEEISRAVA
jgi:hypothetical protein